ncbi:hypothetical protein [Streptomyces abikoensis]|uniref:Uncharacterized protein n=1 Tax=Streptomyces abikoensis TaxID=97398 RepID=A0ABW7T709_9ACTN
MSSRHVRYGFVQGEPVRLARPESKAKEKLLGRVAGFATTAFWGEPQVMVTWLGTLKAVGYHPSELAHSDVASPPLK